ncbi:hypothetical protein WBJ53_04850 [Spirosoma sp. SC4-14]|uniref:hypothetical protein n=1 Tax=Spirosoma sp. SC4-14 TaxID=3128900 RepID=UPI0030CE2B40
MAHNNRNTYTNQFNNPLRMVKKYQRSESRQMLLFPVSQMVKLTDNTQAGIEYRKGTWHEVEF